MGIKCQKGQKVCVTTSAESLGRSLLMIPQSHPSLVEWPIQDMNFDWVKIFFVSIYRPFACLLLIWRTGAVLPKVY